MGKQQNILEYIRNFETGKYNSPDVGVQCDAGWYDWFCKDSSLLRRTKALTSKLKRIMLSSKIDITKNYVFFKNNCPMVGGTYDDFRICSIETSDVIFTITPKDPRTGKAEVWGKENDFKELLVSGSWDDVEKFFLNKESVSV